MHLGAVDPDSDWKAFFFFFFSQFSLMDSRVGHILSVSKMSSPKIFVVVVCILGLERLLPFLFPYFLQKKRIAAIAKKESSAVFSDREEFHAKDFVNKFPAVFEAFIEAEPGEVSVEESSMGAEVVGFAENKAKALNLMREEHLDLIVVGLWQPLFPLFVSHMEWRWEEKYIFVEGAADKRKLDYNCDPPTLHVVETRERKRVAMLVVPPGRDYVMCVVKAHRLMLNEDKDDTVRRLNVKGMFSRKLLDPDAYIAWTGLDTYVTRERIQGSSVILGRPDKISHTMNKESFGRDIDQDELTGPKKHEHFGYRLLIPTGTKRKILLLGVRSSFWGDISYALAGALFKLGAEELFHCAVKVGTFVDAHQVCNQRITPRKFSLWVPEGDSLENKMMPVELTNVFASTPGESFAPHLTVPNPLDETRDIVSHVKSKEGVGTVDDEGAYMAKAAKEANKIFGGMYYASDYVLAYHENHAPEGSQLTKKLRPDATFEEEAKFKESEAKKVEDEKRINEDIVLALWRYFEIPPVPTDLNDITDRQRNSLLKEFQNVTYQERKVVFWQAPAKVNEKDVASKIVHVEDFVRKKRSEPVFLIGMRACGKTSWLKNFALNVKGFSPVYIPLFQAFKLCSHSNKSVSFNDIFRAWCASDLRILEGFSDQIVWLFDEYEDVLQEPSMRDLLEKLIEGNLGLLHSIVALVPDALPSEEEHFEKITLACFNEDERKTFVEKHGRSDLLNSEMVRNFGGDPGMLQLLCREKFELEVMYPKPFNFLKAVLKKHFKGHFEHATSSVQVGLELLDKSGIRNSILESALRVLVFLSSHLQDVKLNSWEWEMAIEDCVDHKALLMKRRFCTLNKESNIKQFANAGLLHNDGVREMLRTEGIPGVEELSHEQQAGAFQVLSVALAESGYKDAFEASTVAYNIVCSTTCDKVLELDVLRVHAWNLYYAEKNDTIEVADLALGKIEGFLSLENNMDNRRELIMQRTLFQSFKGRQLQRRSQYDEAAVVLNQAIKDLESLAPRGSELLVVLKEAGWNLRGQGELLIFQEKKEEARPFLEKAQVLLLNACKRRELLFGSDLSYGTILRQLGSLTRDFAELEDPGSAKRKQLLVESEALYKNALEIKGVKLVDSHPEISTIIHELGKVLTMQGPSRFVEADAFLEKARVSREKVLGEKDTSTARTYHAIAELRLAQGEVDEAWRLGRKAREIYGEKSNKNVQELEKFLARDEFKAFK